MSANKSQDAAAADAAADPDDAPAFQPTGTGAASALERMKAEHALRHKRQHGMRAAGPGHEEDHTPER